MNNEQYEAMVAKLEARAEQQPGLYLVSVLLVAFAGFGIMALAIGYSLLLVLLLAGLGVAVVATGGKALILLAKLGKLLILLAISSWVMVKDSLSMLFTRLPPPEGRELLPEEAPVLFSKIKAMRLRMNGPEIHHVLITDELNAAIVQHPALGLLGWERNYLILGLPLLQTLGEDEALSVVAHEYGHLSGYHSRWGGFIYRFRAAWGRMQELSGQWDSAGAKLIARLFRWYAPYFNAYTFVLARKNEYVADRAAMELTSREAAQSALVRVNVAAYHEQETFWPDIRKRIAHESQPIASKSSFWTQSLTQRLDGESRTVFLTRAMKEETGFHDTHPSLRDRLEALGVESGEVTVPELPEISAAEVWLGTNLPHIQQEMDAQWSSSVSENWQGQHARLQEMMARRAELAAAMDNKDHEATADELWEYVSLLEELAPEEDLVPNVEQLLSLQPDHTPALYMRGRLRIQAGDDAGVADVEAAMAADADAILPGCELLWRHFLERDAERAASYASRWEERNDYLRRLEHENSNLPSDATLVAPDLPDEVMAEIASIVRSNSLYIKRIWLLKRIFNTDAAVSDHVLAFEVSPWSFGDNSGKVLERLVSKQFPMPMFVVSLRSDLYKGFRKKIKALKLAPIYEA